MSTNNDDEEQIQLSPGGTRRSRSQASEKWKTRCLNMLMTEWNRILIFSSVIGVFGDPLFFYVPFLDEEKKCIGVDKKLRIAVLILRSLTDSTTLVDIMLYIRKTFEPSESEFTRRNSNKVKKFSMYFMFQILIVLPIPQVLVLVLFFRMRGNRYFKDRMMMNVFLFLQYIPRMYHIYLLSKQLSKQVHIWLKVVFYLFMYILGSHILGAFFYFFSIQRVTSCWHQTCKNSGGCTSTYHCGDHTSTSVNITLLTELCPISPTNATMFDFGIFGDGLQIGNLGSISFSQKLFYFVWWGLRNLSNYGTNLETSSYVWENCFAIFISFGGLLLFLYCIGNVQQYMLWEAEKQKQRDETREMRTRKKQEIQLWMSDKRVPENLEKEIMEEIDRRLDGNELLGADLDDLFSILSTNTKRDLTRFLSMDRLRKVSRLQGMADILLDRICDNLEPVKYEAGRFFVKMEEPLDRLILITDGSMLVYTSTSATDSSPSRIHMYVEDGDVYGDEPLLSWALSDSNMRASLANLPISKENVKCTTKVRGFALTAKRLRVIMSLFKNTLSSIPTNRNP